VPVARGGFAVAASVLIALMIAADPLSLVRQATNGARPAPPSGTTPPEPTAAVEPAAPEPRLVAGPAERGVNDQAVALGMAIDHPDNAGGLLIDGLPDGANLTTGKAAGASQWYVPAADVADILVQPPHGFVGAMDLSVELRLAGGRVVERRPVRLEWAPPPERNPPARAAAVTPPAEAGLPVRKLDADEIATLRKRGEVYFANGDVAAARLVLQRAAEAADARAALALAATYDPIALDDIGIRGAFADPAIARTWYERAKAFGSPEAPHRLELLASREH